MDHQKKYKPDSLQATWIRTDIGLGKEPIEWAQLFGTYLAHRDKKEKLNELSTSQIRRFFGQIKRLQAKGYTQESRSDLLMLKPQLAYAVGRDKKKSRRGWNGKIAEFYHEIHKAIEAIEDQSIQKEQQYFKNFVNLLEAIVAYHRYAGGE